MGKGKLWLRFVLRPLGRLVGTDRWEPHAVGPVHCFICGSEYIAVISTASPCYDPETGVIDGLECQECGQPVVRSD